MELSGSVARVSGNYDGSSLYMYSGYNTKPVEKVDKVDSGLQGPAVVDKASPVYSTKPVEEVGKVQYQQQEQKPLPADFQAKADAFQNNPQKKMNYSPGDLLSLYA